MSAVPVDSDTDSSLSIPNLELSKTLFKIKNNGINSDNSLYNEFFKTLTDSNMLYYYEYACNQLNLKTDDNLITKMKAVIDSKITELDAEINVAKTNHGDIEVRDAIMKKALYYCQLGSYNESMEFLKQAYDKTTTVGNKIDNLYLQIRINLLYDKYKDISSLLNSVNCHLETGGDWERRNRFKSYQALYFILIRNFRAAADNFLDTIATFTSTELLSFTCYVKFAILSSAVSLSRHDFNLKILKGSEIQETLIKCPVINDFVTSLFNCNYKHFFLSLLKIEELFLSDKYLSTHTSYYIREMKIIAYKQLLQPYSTLTLKYMAECFGVSLEFIDKELSKLISNGRINSKIDKVSGYIITTRESRKNSKYQEIIKHGDILLNRIQKLSYFVSI